jgi:MULE transposase domain
VVTFDTTYSTNRYSMPLGPFIGVNHHRHNIYFGCALIRDEKKTTFVWLFETWLQAMGGKHPNAIITYQDPAMKAAIAIVFPNAIHRFCQWHIMRKARDHLGILYGSIPEFKYEMRAIIDYSWTILEFEKNW